MPVDGPRLCRPCQDWPTPRHEDCEGQQSWCECITELLIEAETEHGEDLRA